MNGKANRQNVDDQYRGLNVSGKLSKEILR